MMRLYIFNQSVFTSQSIQPRQETATQYSTRYYKMQLSKFSAQNWNKKCCTVFCDPLSWLRNSEVFHKDGGSKPTQILMEGPNAAHSQYLLGEKQRAVMMSLWSRVWRCLPSFKSQSIAFMSLPPEAHREPSGETVTVFK